MPKGAIHFCHTPGLICLDDGVEKLQEGEAAEKRKKFADKKKAAKRKRDQEAAAEKRGGQPPPAAKRARPAIDASATPLLRMRSALASSGAAKRYPPRPPGRWPRSVPALPPPETTPHQER